jgi:hypothetical protein
MARPDDSVQADRLLSPMSDDSNSLDSPPHLSLHDLKTNYSELTFGYDLAHSSRQKFPKLSPLIIRRLISEAHLNLGSPLTENSNEDMIVSVKPAERFMSNAVSPADFSQQVSSRTSVDFSTHFETLDLAPTTTNKIEEDLSPHGKALRVIRANIRQKCEVVLWHDVATERTKKLFQQRLPKPSDCHCIFSWD